MIQIPDPNTKEWSQPNTSDLFGNVFQTKNITFDTQGYLRLSYSPRAALDQTTANFNNPAVFLYSEDYGYFTATWDSAFQTDERILAISPSIIATAGVPTTDIQSDAVYFGGLMPVTQDTDVDYYDPSANTWTDTNISLSSTSQTQHQAVSFLSLSALAIADVNTVKLYATPLTATPTLLVTLTISADFHITGMCYFNQNLYIATQNRYGGHAYMYVWNGLGTAANQVYEVDSNMIFSICAHQNQVVCFTGNGSLLGFNGGGFDVLATFPIYYYDQSLSDTVNIGMYKNIMKSNGNLLYILFSNQGNNANRLLSMPDGVWCYDSRVGLYHRYSVSNALVEYLTIVAANVNTTTNQITVPSSTYPTGTEIVYTDDGFGLAPLVDGTKYFVIRVDATHIQLAETYADAIAGTAIDLTSAGAQNFFTVYPNIDFGQFYTERTMALTVIERPVDNPKYGTDVLWGGEVYRRDDENADYGTMGTVANYIGARGYFITPKIFSADVTDIQNLVTLKFSPFTTELDKIIIKYRTSDDMKVFINIDDWKITWASTTSFTTTADWSGAVVGDEVEVLRGAAGGLLAHITAISEVGGTYTVTIDETYADYVAGDVATAISRNFKKWKTISYGDSNALKCFLSEQLGAEGKFVQFKIELRGVQTRIEEFLVDNVYRLPAKSPRR